MNDAIPWLTLVLAFLGSVLGGVGAQWLSHRLQRQQAREDRRRQALIELQRAIQGHLLSASEDYAWRGAHFRSTGEWPPFVVNPSKIVSDRPPVYANHLIPRIGDDELGRLVRECLQSLNEATLLAPSAAEADQAMNRAIVLHNQARDRIATLLAQIP